MAELITINSEVKQKGIRKENYNGRPHLVVQSYTLPFDVVMNGGLYPAKEILAHFQELEGTLAPLGHPFVDGEYISAYSAEALNVNYCGAWNRNVKQAGNRISVEKWIDIEVAERTENGRRLVNRVTDLMEGNSDDPISTSVGVYLDRVTANSEDGYEWVAKIDRIDHDAILLDEEPAADPSKGVGMAVNTADAVPVVVPSAFSEMTYRQRENLLSAAVRAWEDDRWISDFTDDQVVLGGDSGYSIHAYTIEGGKATVSTEGSAVQRQESWYSVNRLLRAFRGAKKTPEANELTAEDENMALTAEEKTELLDGVKELLAPITERLDSIEQKHDGLVERVEAIGAEGEEEMRAEVSSKLGADAAKALTGNALRAVYDGIKKESRDLAPNSAGGGLDLDHFDEVPE